MPLYLIRHAETPWSANGQHTGMTDLALTENGKLQALQLQKRLQSLAFDTVLCSPLQRARQTCELLRLPSPQFEPRLIEWNYGDYEGLTSPEIHAKNPGWNIFKNGAPNGETPEAVQKRAKQLLESLQTLPGNVALVSHGHFLRALTTVWLDLPIEAGALFYLSPASLSILGFERQQHVIHLWNEIALDRENTNRQNG